MSMLRHISYIDQNTAPDRSLRRFETGLVFLDKWKKRFIDIPGVNLEFLHNIFGSFADLSCGLYFSLQSNPTDELMKTLQAVGEMSQFFGQNAEVRAAKKLTSDVCRKILITKSSKA